MNLRAIIPLFSLSFISCSDFYSAYTSHGAPEIPPDTIWSRSDTLAHYSFSLEQQSFADLHFEVDSTVPAQGIRLRSLNQSTQKSQTLWSGDSLRQALSIAWDSTTSTSKSLDQILIVEYQVTQEDAGPLFTQVKLEAMRPWIDRAGQILAAGASRDSSIAILAGDSIRIWGSLIKVRASLNNATTTLWDNSISASYQHKFTTATTLNYRVQNEGTSIAPFADHVEVIRTIAPIIGE